MRKLLAFAGILSLFSLPLTAQENSQLPAIYDTPPPSETKPDASPEPVPSTPVETPAPAPAPASTEAAAPTAPEEPITTEFSGEVTKPKPTEKKKEIPQTFGDRTGEVWVGHRSIIDRYNGWGWIKKEKEPWSRAKWAFIEEHPPQMQAPGRFLRRPTEDADMEYRLYGEWTDYQGYEPNYDVFVDVFRIKGFEIIGKAAPIDRNPPRASNSGATGRYSERGANQRFNR